MRYLNILVFIVSCFSLSAQTDISGNWNMGKENTIVHISNEDGVCTGTIISSDNDQLKEEILILKNLKPDGDSWKGKLFSFKKQKWFKVTLKRDEEILNAKIKAGLMSKKLEWTKA